MQKGDNEYTESICRPRDTIRVSEVFVLRHIQIPHSRRAKNRPCVTCRRVSINIRAIYNTVYGILSRRVICIKPGNAGLVSYVIMKGQVIFFFLP